MTDMHVPEDTRFAAQQAVTTLRDAYGKHPYPSHRQRVRNLRALRHLLADNADDLAAAVHDDTGKAPSETFLMEINLAISEIDFILHRLRGWMTSRPVALPFLLLPASGKVVKEPKGVVLIIAPWNYPVLLLLEPLAGALAAGNRVLLKPSNHSPNTSELITKLIPRYLDSDTVQILNGGSAMNTAILEQEFDHIFFTGSPALARTVMSAAAQHLTPVTLELGGKSPVFVDSSVDLGVTADRIAWGRFTNSGQTCVSPDYILTTENLVRPLADELHRAATRMYGEDPSKSPDYSRIVNDRHFERVTGLIDSSGTILHGGRRDAKTRYIEPTMLGGVSGDDPVMGEEIFGPVLPILAVKNASEAIAFINARPRPLALYVFSSSRRVRAQFQYQTNSGALVFGMTNGHLVSSRLPFGGTGNSGMGNYHGRRSFDTFTHDKPVVSKPLHPDTLGIVYPPYTDAKQAIMRFVSHLGFSPQK
ncbi:MAG: aldehyde dehydrogenase family protein [Propionibacteriaceae bacterium]|jgi:aldehyde dehydrogenase (NAD+)|nr:aldehyde dehydrogenase family protein [Propionibacteriaceae bacterium]